MASKTVIFTAFIIFNLASIEALRLLVWFPLYSRSHGILGLGVVNRLLEAGHEVVHITAFPRETPIANLTEISMEEAGKQRMANAQRADNFKLKNLVGKGGFGDSIFFIFLMYDIHKSITEDPAFINLLKDPKQKFDGVILEWFFADSIAGLASLFKCPLIWFGSTEAHWQVLRLVDEIPNPAYSVDLFSTSRPPLNIWERFYELYLMIKKMLIYGLLVAPFEKSLYNKVFLPIDAERGVDMPSYEEAVYNGSLLLINSHPSIGTPYRLPQNAKYIGGYHIDSNVNPMPKDLQKIMDNSKHGVIYFSMGSNLKSMDMSDHMRDSLLKLFGNLKQTVIWKFEGDLDKVPANVHLVKWAPQLGILSHPKTKFFITHGGQLSTTEAIHLGVPVIGLPVFGDQHMNMRSVVNRGFGITVKLADDMIGELNIAINEMLTNTAYKIKAKELSYIYHNRQQKPGDELVFWVEHVVSTKGAPHLRSPAFTLPFYKRMYIDIIIILVLILIVFVKIIKKISFKKSKNNIKEKSH